MQRHSNVAEGLLEKCCDAVLGKFWRVENEEDGEQVRNLFAAAENARRYLEKPRRQPMDTSSILILGISIGILVGAFITAVMSALGIK
jgi:hypothetical protein